jgi:hypothetical protein
MKIILKEELFTLFFNKCSGRNSSICNNSTKNHWQCPGYVICDYVNSDLHKQSILIIIIIYGILLINNTLFIKYILLCVFHKKKDDSNNILNMYTDIVKTFG